MTVRRGDNLENTASQLVSVVVPTRDRPRALRRAVESVLAQTGVTVEVIVIDDCSTVPVQVGVELDEPRVRVVRHDRNLGVAAARNAGIAVAAGHWIAFLDDDDVWAPDKLRRQLDAAERDQRDWCIASALIVDAVATVKLVSQCPADHNTVAARLCIHNAVPGGGSGVVVRRTLLERAGLFDESLSMMADYEMWHRLSHFGPCAIVTEPVVGYTAHAASMTANFRSHLDEMERVNQLARAYCASPAAARRDHYLDWAASGMTTYNRIGAARMKAALAVRRRSPKEMVMAARYLLVPASVSVMKLVGRERPVPQEPTPCWLTPLEPRPAPSREPAQLEPAPRLDHIAPPSVA